METTTLMTDGIERTILATLLWGDGINSMEIFSNCKKEYFYNERHGRLFEVLQDRFVEGKPLNDLIMVAQDLQAAKVEMNLVDLMSITDTTSPSASVTEHLDALRNGYLRRQLKNTMIQYQQVFEDQTTDIGKSLSTLVEALMSTMGMSEEKTVCLEDVLTSLRKVISDNMADRVKDSMLTGFKELDMYGGLHPCDLVVIGADSSQGKTALAINIAVNAARLSQTKVAVFSLEMSSLELGARILSPETRLPASVLMYRKLKEKTCEEVDTAIRGLQGIGKNMFFGDAAVQTIDEIITSIRLFHARYGTRLVVVDYLQIISFGAGKDTTREEQLASGARKLKNIAKELGICVILLSQLNRDGARYGGNEPTASRIRGSGQIFEASDLLILIFRPEVYGEAYPGVFSKVETKGTAMLKVAKDRHGGYGGVRAFIVGFDAASTRFESRE